MRTIKYLAILCLLIVSCEATESEGVIDNGSADLKMEQGTNGFQGNKNSTEQFESMMQWGAFLTAYTIFHDELARAELLNAIPAGENSFELNQLFFVSNDFELAFKAYFDLYANSCYQSKPACPETAGSFPDPPLGGGGNIQAVLYSDFRADLIQNNCLELYFPNELVFEQQESKNFVINIVTTAHPLNNNPFNNGFKLFANHGENPSAAVTNIDGNYIVDKNVIVLRPYQNLEDSNCYYEQFGVGDFTDFLCILNCNG